MTKHAALQAYLGDGRRTLLAQLQSVDDQLEELRAERARVAADMGSYPDAEFIREASYPELAAAAEDVTGCAVPDILFMESPEDDGGEAVVLTGDLLFLVVR